MAVGASGYSHIGRIMDSYYFIVDNAYEKIYRNLLGFEKLNKDLLNQR